MGALICGAIIGFTIAFGSSILGQYIDADGDWGKVNAWEALYDGVFGAISGMLAATGIGTLYSVALSGALNGVSGYLSAHLFEDGQYELTDLLIDVGLGMICGLISGNGSGQIIDKFIPAKNILAKTIAHHKFHVVTRQAAAVVKHSKDLWVNGVRYFVGAFETIIVSKNI